MSSPHRNDGELGPFEDGRPAPLRGRSAREVLARLCDGDPLELGPRCSARIDERALLLDPGRLTNRAAARIAYDALRWRGAPPLAAFLTRAIDRAMGELVEEEAESAFHGLADAERALAHYGFLADLLGLEPSITGRACAAFNALPQVERETFWAVCLRRERILDVAVRSQRSADDVRSELRATFELLSRAAGRKIRQDGEAYG